MYIPPAFRVADIAEIHRTMREARSATIVTATEEGLIGTPVPMLLDETEGANGTLYAHVARSIHSGSCSLPARGWPSLRGLKPMSPRPGT